MFSDDLWQMINNPDYDEDVIKEHRLNSFRKVCVFLKETQFETSN